MGVVEDWGLTPAELNDILSHRPSVRGMLMGFVGEYRLSQMHFADARIHRWTRYDDHDRNRQGDFWFTYQGVQFPGVVTNTMYALTVWQPWASFIMAGGKPFEFRHWDYRTRNSMIQDQRIVIHAGARPVKPEEVVDILRRLKRGDSSLDPDIVTPIIDRLFAAHKCRGVLPLSCGLGTAVLGKPRRVDALFQSPDSDRIDHHMWAWPLTDIEHFEPPEPRRGAQGFWVWKRGP